MKKVFSLFCVLALVCVLASCGSQENGSEISANVADGKDSSFLENETQDKENDATSKDCLTVTVNVEIIDDTNDEYERLGNKEITLEIPSFDDLEDIDVKNANLMLADESRCIYDKNGVFVGLCYGIPGSPDEIYIRIRYKNDEFTVENIYCGGIEAEFGEKDYELFFDSTGKTLCYRSQEYDITVEGYTYTGYECRAGEFFDDKGTKITEDDFYNEFSGIMADF